MSNPRKPDHVSAVQVTHTGRGIIAAIYEKLTGEPIPDSDLCAQCLSNARWNDAGGYHELAEKCRQYCRNGHRD